MKHFHGTPISGTKVAQAQVLRRRFALIPWKAPSALEIAKEVCVGFVADNSAYRFWRTGEKPNWNDYATWLKGFCRHPRFEFAIIPDVIDGTEEENDELLAWWELQKWFPYRIRSCPVWHLNESLNRLKRLTRHEMIALGSSGEYSDPGSNKWHDRMAEAMDILCDEEGYPLRRIYGLRMLDPRIVSQFPFYGADSTNIAQNGLRKALSLGSDDPAWGSEIIAGRIERVQSPATWKRRERFVAADLFSSEGYMESA